MGACNGGSLHCVGGDIHGGRGKVGKEENELQSEISFKRRDRNDRLSYCVRPFYRIFAWGGGGVCTYTWESERKKVRAMAFPFNEQGGERI